MKILTLQPDELTSKWTLDKLKSLNENDSLDIEHNIWKAVLWPSPGEFVYVATYRKRPVAMMAVQEWTVAGDLCVYVHQFSSLKRGFGRRLFNEVQKRYKFIYLQSYSSFDQPRLDAYYTGLGMTRLVDGCATFFHKANGLSRYQIARRLKFFRDKY